MNIVLAYYNLRDKWSDEKTFWVPLDPWFSEVPIRKPQNGIKKNRKIKSLLDELIRLEKEKCASLDEAAEPLPTS